MARKKEAEKPENHERWLVSWADFMTLMFALFVTLYSNAIGASASSATQAKMEQLSESIKAAFEKMGIFDEGTGYSPLSTGVGPGKEPLWISQPTIVNLPSPPPQGPSTDFPMPGMAKIEPIVETRSDEAIAESDAELFNELRNQLGAELSEGKIQMRPTSAASPSPWEKRSFSPPVPTSCNPRPFRSSTASPKNSSKSTNPVWP
jgi:chemotaxis protein MotB